MMAGLISKCLSILDRHSGATDEQKKEEEKLFKEVCNFALSLYDIFPAKKWYDALQVNEAYSVLSDAKKRARYDSGQDLEDSFGMADGNVNPILVLMTFLISLLLV